MNTNGPDGAARQGGKQAAHAQSAAQIFVVAGKFEQHVRYPRSPKSSVPSDHETTCARRHGASFLTAKFACENGGIV